jgi:hypothetical protein
MPTMFFQHERIIIGSLGAEEDAEGGSVAEPAPQYRPRHPERSAFYQLFDGHFDSYVRLYEERFEGAIGTFTAGGGALCRGVLIVWETSRRLRAHSLHEMWERASSGVFLPHEEFLLQLPGQALCPVCRKDRR